MSKTCTDEQLREIRERRDGWVDSEIPIEFYRGDISTLLDAIAELQEDREIIMRQNAAFGKLLTERDATIAERDATIEKLEATFAEMRRVYRSGGQP